MMQRLMDDDTTFANDLFCLNMLRLSEQGGPVDYIGMGYTCDDDQTVSESVLMRENQHDKMLMLKAFLITQQEGNRKRSICSSNIGGVWYDVVRLTLELNMNTYDLISTVEPEYWQRIARMISCQHPQLRARASVVISVGMSMEKKKNDLRQTLKTFRDNSVQLSSIVMNFFKTEREPIKSNQLTWPLMVTSVFYVKEFTLKYRRMQLAML